MHECARHNKQLLTIDSVEKQNVISKLLKEEIYDCIWLGANDEFIPSGRADHPFFWSATGKQFTYANWDVENPFNIEIDRNWHCVLICLKNMKWINYKCEDLNGYICEENKLLESSKKQNPNNISDIVQKFINDFELKLQSSLKDNMIQLNGQLENIKQVSKDINHDVEKLTNITQTAVQDIRNKQEISTKELNHEITKQANDISDQLKRSVDELNTKLSEKQNVIQNGVF